MESIKINRGVNPEYGTTGTQYGGFVCVKGELTKEKLAEAKETLVDEVCRTIREIATEREDFFIIKDCKDFTPYLDFGGATYTIACKFYLPTVKENEFDRITDNPVAEIE